MSFYDEMAGLSSDMISEFGRDVVITRPNDAATFDPAKGEDVAGFWPVQGAVNHQWVYQYDTPITQVGLDGFDAYLTAALSTGGGAAGFIIPQVGEGNSIQVTFDVTVNLIGTEPLRLFVVSSDVSLQGQSNVVDISAGGSFNETLTILPGSASNTFLAFVVSDNDGDVDFEVRNVTIEYATPVVTTQTVKAVRLTLSKGSLGSLSEQYMEDFVRGKMYMMLISGLGPDFKPRSGDTLTMDSEDYEIIGNNVLSPAGTDVLYKVPVRMA